MIKATARYLCVLSLFLIVLSAVGAAPLMRVTFIDVEQGDCILIRTAEKTVLIDAGDDKRDAANSYIIPYLKREGIKHIDTVVISHPHRDHFGGMLDLIPAISIGEVYYSTDELSEIGEEDTERETIKGSEAQLYQRMHDMLVERDIPYIKCKMSDKLDWGKGIKVEIFHTEDKKASGAENDPLKANQNENSIIMKVTAGKVSYLFTGDAEKGAEEYVVQNFAKKLKSTVLKSGHHGSVTSSSHPFLDAVRPEYAVIMVGARNSFGHPRQETLDKYEYYKTKTFRTDLDGNVESFTDGETVQFVTNNSPVAFAKNPELISLTPNSATIQWTTNKEATTALQYGSTALSKEKVIDHSVKTHTVTITGLKPNQQYIFKAISNDPREPQKFVEFDGTFKTPEGNGIALPVIKSVETNFDKIYMKHPFKLLIPVENKSEEAAKDIYLDIYHSAMDPSNLIDQVKFTSIPAQGSVDAVVPTEIGWVGNVEIIAVLRQGKSIIDTVSMNIKVLSKLFLVDCAHGNIDYFIGKFSGMKMDLYQKLGFQMRSISKSITTKAIEDAFVVAIPHPDKDFTAAELTALKKYVTEGGSIIMFGQADYRDTSNPQFQNKLLAKIGSRIRFNDDEVCDDTNNIGAPWRFFVTTFPADHITTGGVKQLLTKSCCSLLNKDMKGLKSLKNLYVLASGDNDTYNIEVDGKADGVIYASMTTKLPVPIAACEDLGTGRVACIGDKFYQDSYYNPKSELQTPLFNSQVISWLSLSKEKTLKELFSYAASLDNEDDAELKADRASAVVEKLIKKIRADLDAKNTSPEEINAMMNNFDSRTVDGLKPAINSMIKFKEVHEE